MKATTPDEIQAYFYAIFMQNLLQIYANFTSCAYVKLHEKRHGRL
jgi:hypothetical protein